MPSDTPVDPAIDGGWQRLHPLTLLFAIGTRLYHSRALFLPAILALVVSRRRASHGGWDDFRAGCSCRPGCCSCSS